MTRSLNKDSADYSLHYKAVGNLIGFSFAAMMIAGCGESASNDILNTAAIHFAGVFITEHVKSGSVLRIEGRPDLKKETDSTFYVTGMLEEFSALNYPIGVKYFNETLFYSGSNPNKRESWRSINIYVGNKK